jgi:UDP:flavonoid glycosyltransferase YjiC (YdhE family)
VVRALASGTPVVACPHAGDMAENAARVRWAGVGVSLPRRFHTPRGVRLAVRRLLSDPGYTARASEIHDWCTTHDGAATAADELEAFAATGVPRPLRV